jgi:hypothetical protein
MLPLRTALERVRGMHPKGQRKCRNCSGLFLPTAQNRRRQRYCSKPECQQASAAASYRKWENRPENRGYNRSEAKSRKVKDWQKEHPDYWKKRNRKRTVLPKISTAESADGKVDVKQDGGVLPKVWQSQSPLVIGLIAQVTGCVLPKDIATITGQLIARGQALMGQTK